jgi:hypothetical protein
LPGEYGFDEGIAGTSQILKQINANFMIRHKCSAAEDPWMLPFLLENLPEGKQASDYNAPGATQKDLWEMLQISVRTEWTENEGTTYLVPSKTLANWLEIKENSGGSYRYVRHSSILFSQMTNGTLSNQKNRICYSNGPAEMYLVYGSVRQFICRCISYRKERQEVENRKGDQGI